MSPSRSSLTEAPTSGSRSAAGSHLHSLATQADERARRLRVAAAQMLGTADMGELQVGVIFIIFVVMRAMDRVFSKRVVDRMANYQLMYFNLLWPIGVQVASICLGWVLYQRFFCENSAICPFSATCSGATAAGTPYPQWRLALFSMWTS